MNRRGFIAALAGIATWAKTSFSRSPAASAIPPTCKPIRLQCDLDRTFTRETITITGDTPLAGTWVFVGNVLVDRL